MDAALNGVHPRLLALRDEHVQRLLGRDPNVVGIGVGYAIKGGALTEEPALVVYVKEKVTAPVANALPRMIDGFRVDVVEAPFQELAEASIAADPRLQQQDPLVGGISVGPDYLDGQRGTLGFCGTAIGSTKAVLVSNYHVLVKGTPKQGDDVAQPSRQDSILGRGVKCATLLTFIRGNHRYGGVDYGVDAASAEIIAGRRGSNPRTLMGLPGTFPDQTAWAVAGEKVVKYGAMTGGRQGSVAAVGVAVTTKSGTILPNQITVLDYGLPFSQEGDSGALVLRAADFVPVGLLWGGVAKNSCAAPIQPVLDALQVQF
jgi:hypothetical protein